MSLELFHNYFGITVKNRKNDENFGFSTFERNPEINMELLQNYRNPR